MSLRWGFVPAAIIYRASSLVLCFLSPESYSTGQAMSWLLPLQQVLWASASGSSQRLLTDRSRYPGICGRLLGVHPLNLNHVQGCIWRVLVEAGWTQPELSVPVATCRPGRRCKRSGIA